jgi:hypothetical protein
MDSALVLIGETNFHHIEASACHIAIFIWYWSYADSKCSGIRIADQLEQGEQAFNICRLNGIRL